MKFKREKFLASNTTYDAWLFSDPKDTLHLGFFNLEDQTFEGFTPLGYYKEDGEIPDFIVESALKHARTALAEMVI